MKRTPLSSRPTADALSLVCLFLIAAGAAGCSGSRDRPRPTFTPVPSAAGGSARVVASPPAHPVVSADCLQSLSSYRFAGTLSLRPPDSPAEAGTSAVSGSLANLLRNVTFEGAAQAPDRYQARIHFGGNGVQPLEIIRIGAETFSRFGDAQWQKGDQIQGLGGLGQFDPQTGLGQFDPQTLCTGVLSQIDAGNQAPERETVNGVPSRRHQLAGAQALSAFGGRATPPAARAPTATPASTAAEIVVWEAEKGGYPVRFRISSAMEQTAIMLLVDVTDVNGKDIQISSPPFAPGP